jgi:hypothetical protein
MVRDLGPPGPIRGNPEGDVLPLPARAGQGLCPPSPTGILETFEANPRPIRVIATTMGLSPRQVRNLLYRRGYDAEVRIELARSVCPKCSKVCRKVEGRTAGRENLRRGQYKGTP